MIVAIILGIIFCVSLIGLYLFSYIANRKTKIPKGCELAYLEATCSLCMTKGCGIGPQDEEGDDK